MDESQLGRLGAPQAQVSQLVAVEEGDLLDEFLAGRRPTTLRAYAKALADFAAFLELASAAAAVESLIAGTTGRAVKLVLGYKAHLTDRGLAPATMARRLAAIRSMVKLGGTLGHRHPLPEGRGVPRHP